MKKQVWCKGTSLRGGKCFVCGYSTETRILRPHLDRRWVNRTPPFSKSKPDDAIDGESA